MSEASYIPPSPPPPPAAPPPQPPAPGTTATFDFLKPFTFIFNDPRWLTKVLIGGLFYIASIFIVGIFFVLGYYVHLVRNVIAGVEHPAPEWDDLGDFFSEGLRMFGVVLVYTLPFIAVAFTLLVPAMVAGAFSEHDRDAAGDFAGGLAGCAMCFLVPAGLLFSAWLPAAMLMTAVDGKFGSAFQFGRIWSFISANLGAYVLAWLVFLIARFASGLGIIIFCVGVFFTAFWAMAVSAYGFAQVYRGSVVK